MTAVSVDASYEECAAVEGLTGSTLRPAYDVRLMVKQVIPASLESHDITIDADVSGTYSEVQNIVGFTQPPNFIVSFVCQMKEC